MKLDTFHLNQNSPNSHPRVIVCHRPLHVAVLQARPFLDAHPNPFSAARLFNWLFQVVSLRASVGRISGISCQFQDSCAHCPFLGNLRLAWAAKELPPTSPLLFWARRYKVLPSNGSRHRAKQPCHTSRSKRMLGSCLVSRGTQQATTRRV